MRVKKIIEWLTYLFFLSTLGGAFFLFHLILPPFFYAELIPCLVCFVWMFISFYIIGNGEEIAEYGIFEQNFITFHLEVPGSKFWNYTQNIHIDDIKKIVLLQEEELSLEAFSLKVLTSKGTFYATNTEYLSTYLIKYNFFTKTHWEQAKQQTKKGANVIYM